MPGLFGLDVYSPAQIADRVEQTSAAKARLPLLSMPMLGELGGAFIGLGALHFVIVRSDPALSYAPKQILGGMTFALGLILVVVAGAELFIGNNMLVMAWAAGRI